MSVAKLAKATTAVSLLEKEPPPLFRTIAMLAKDTPTFFSSVGHHFSKRSPYYFNSGSHPFSKGSPATAVATLTKDTPAFLPL